MPYFHKKSVAKRAPEDQKASFPQKLRVKANKKAEIGKNKNTIAKKQIL